MDAKTAFVTKVDSIFGRGKLKEFEHRNEDLQSRILEIEKHAQRCGQHIKEMEQKQANQIGEIKPKSVIRD